ncbi:MAG: GNAT family N-acetyltransferase [Magnetococcus sp. WYHC-3]
MPHPPIPSPSIRWAQPGDLDALVRLEQVCFSGDRLSRRSFRHLLRHGHALILVASCESGLAGYTLLLLRRGLSHGRIYSLAVDPAWRGGGVGRRLLDALETEARSRNLAALRLEVRADNDAALGLYRAAGYGLLGHRPDYYADHCAAWRMEKPLTAHSTPPATPSSGELQP